MRTHEFVQSNECEGDDGCGGPADHRPRYMHTGREQMRAAIKRLAPVGSQRAAEPKAPRK